MSENVAVYLDMPGGYENLHLGRCDAAEPGPGEVTVRIRACSINYHDLALVKGILPCAERRIPLSDGAGEVVAVGEGVDGLCVGDAVVSTFFPDWFDGQASFAGFAQVPGDGIDGYARQWVTRRATAFTRAPRGYSHAESATLTCAGLTAWRALFVDGALKPGQTVLVQGSGGLSIFALQFAKAAGAKVIATSSSDVKLERMGVLGADHLINYRSDKNWGATAFEASMGGVDLVIEAGGGDSLAQSLLAARVGGRIAMIGVLSGLLSEISLPLVLGKQLTLSGQLVGNHQQQVDMIRDLEGMVLRPIIDRHFELADLAQAFHYQEEGRHFGKICIDV